MEKSIGFEFVSYMNELFQMEEVDIREYSPLTLAYIGDCVYRPHALLLSNAPAWFASSVTV